MKLKYLLILLSVPAFGQISYVAQKTTNLSAAAEVITIQQPSSGAKYVELKSLYVECSAACTVTLERDGNPATSTTLVPLAVNPSETLPSVTAWSSSNATVGTVVSVVTVQAGSYLVFDLTGMHFAKKSDRGLNFTMRTSAITGTVNMMVKWTEQ